MAKHHDKYISISELMKNLELLKLNKNQIRSIVKIMEPTLLKELRVLCKNQENNIIFNAIESDQITELLDFFAKNVKSLRDATLSELTSLTQENIGYNQFNIEIAERKQVVASQKISDR